LWTAIDCQCSKWVISTILWCSEALPPVRGLRPPIAMLILGPGTLAFLAPSINYSSCHDVVQLYSVRHSGDMARIRDIAPVICRGFVIFEVRHVRPLLLRAPRALSRSASQHHARTFHMIQRMRMRSRVVSMLASVRLGGVDLQQRPEILLA
jgi:hypothetical protein